MSNQKSLSTLHAIKKIVGGLLKQLEACFNHLIRYNKRTALNVLLWQIFVQDLQHRQLLSHLVLRTFEQLQVLIHHPEEQPRQLPAFQHHLRHQLRVLADHRVHQSQEEVLRGGDIL